jgi:hypothetical protein
MDCSLGFGVFCLNAGSMAVASSGLIGRMARSMSRSRRPARGIEPRAPRPRFVSDHPGTPSTERQFLRKVSLLCGQ